MEVTPLRLGSESGFTADDKLGLHRCQQVGIRVRVSSSRQGRVRVTDRVSVHRQGRSGYTEGCAVVRIRKPDVPPNTGHLFCLAIWLRILLMCDLREYRSRVFDNESCVGDYFYSRPCVGIPLILSLCVRPLVSPFACVPLNPAGTVHVDGFHLCSFLTFIKKNIFKQL